MLVAQEISPQRKGFFLTPMVSKRNPLSHRPLSDVSASIEVGAPAAQQDGDSLPEEAVQEGQGVGCRLAWGGRQGFHQAVQTVAKHVQQPLACRVEHLHFKDLLLAAPDTMPLETATTWAEQGPLETSLIHGYPLTLSREFPPPRKICPMLHSDSRPEHRAPGNLDRFLARGLEAGAKTQKASMKANLVDHAHGGGSCVAKLVSTPAKRSRPQANETTAPFSRGTRVCWLPARCQAGHQHGAADCCLSCSILEAQGRRPQPWDA